VLFVSIVAVRVVGQNRLTMFSSEFNSKFLCISTNFMSLLCDTINGRCSEYLVDFNSLINDWVNFITVVISRTLLV